MSADEDPQQIVAQYEATQAQLQQLDARLTRFEEALIELRRAKSTLESLDASQDALVPIGAGLHVRAQILGDAPVVTPLGAGYAADQSVDDAMARIDSQLTETQSAMESASSQAQSLAQSMQVLTQKLQSMQQQPSS